MFIGDVSNDEMGINISTTTIKSKKIKDGEAGQVSNGVINASTLSIAKQQKKQSLIEEKRESFKKQALSTIEKANKNRIKRLASLEGMENQCKVLEKESQEDRNQIKDLANARTALMEEYGVVADSEEEKELKYAESILFIKKEEDGSEAKLAENFTDYQKRAFEIDKRSKVYTDSLNEKQNQLRGYQQAIIDFKINDVKDHSMIDAYKEAEEIVSKGNKALINQITKEAIEKEQEEIKEKQEEMDKKKEEQGIEQEATKDKIGTEESTVTNQTTTDHMQQQLLKIAERSKLYYEDIKGVAVDEQI